MDKYTCIVCGYVYDPAVGDPDNDIPAGTAFDALPDGLGRALSIFMAVPSGVLISMPCKSLHQQDTCVLILSMMS